jgi:hypothetical protein
VLPLFERIALWRLEVLRQLPVDMTTWKDLAEQAERLLVHRYDHLDASLDWSAWRVPAISRRRVGRSPTCNSFPRQGQWPLVTLGADLLDGELAFMRGIMPLRNDSWPRRSTNPSMGRQPRAEGHLQDVFLGFNTASDTRSGHRVAQQRLRTNPRHIRRWPPWCGLMARPAGRRSSIRAVSSFSRAEEVRLHPRPQSCLRPVKRCRPWHEAWLAPRPERHEAVRRGLSLEESPRLTVSTASWSALFHGRQLAYTVLLTLGVGVHAVGIHLVATVLPSVVTDLGGAAFYTWATMLYTIASIIGTACGGLFKARLNLRRGYMVGVLVELAGWAGCAVAPHIAVLLLARAIQGFGSGLLVALAYSMISEFYVETMRARVLSAISGIWGWRLCWAPSWEACSPPADGGAGRSGSRYRSSSCWEGWPGKSCQAIRSKRDGEFPAARLALLGLGVLGVGQWTRHTGSMALGFAGQRCGTRLVCLSCR